MWLSMKACNILSSDPCQTKDIFQQIEFYLSITDDIPEIENWIPGTKVKKRIQQLSMFTWGRNFSPFSPEWQSSHDSFCLVLFVQCTVHSIVHKVVLLVVFHLNCVSPLSVDWGKKGVTGERKSCYMNCEWVKLPKNLISLSFMYCLTGDGKPAFPSCL